MAIELEKIGWLNKNEAGAKPINKTNLQQMENNTENAINEVDSNVETLRTEITENLQQMKNDTENAINEVEKEFSKNIMTASPTSDVASVTDLSKVNLEREIHIGEKLSLSNGGIKIGAGVEHIIVSAQATPSGFVLESTQLAIYKNEEQITRALLRAGDVQGTMILADKLIEVTEGDSIFMYYAGNSTQLVGKDSLTYLTVEVV